MSATFPRRARVLLVARDPQTAFAIDSVLTPAGFGVVRRPYVRAPGVVAQPPFDVLVLASSGTDDRRLSDLVEGCLAAGRRPVVTVAPGDDWVASLALESGVASVVRLRMGFGDELLRAVRDAVAYVRQNGHPSSSSAAAPIPGNACGRKDDDGER